MIPKALGSQDKLIEMTVKATDLTIVQDYVNPSTVQKYIKSKEYSGIIVAEIDKQKVVIDGNHRFIAAKHEKIKELTVRYIGIINPIK